MKFFSYTLRALALASMAIVMVCSCSKDKLSGGPVNDATGYSFSAEVTVPQGTKTLYIEYTNADGEKKTTSVAVTPELVAPDGAKDVEPFGKVNLTVTSAVQTVADVYYMINDKKVALLDNITICEKVATKAVTASIAQLTEPKEYKTSDLGYTCYHSSGAIFLEDIWPRSTRNHDGKYDTDFNDVVFDYDIEAVVVPDELLASEGWREQVKVVLHLRATSGSEADKAGVILEGFDTEKYVENITEYRTFDSWQNPHGTLPNWTVNTLQAKSSHNETVALRPIVEVGSIYSMKEKIGAGNEEYVRVNDNGSTFTTVLNPNVNNYWKTPKTEQYSSDLADLYKKYNYTTLEKTQKTGYYNVVPGYVNVSGGLYTYTVIYHMKNRSGKTAAEKKEMLDNMIDAVYNTYNQNFYIVLKDGTPVGLPGYEPYDGYVNKYNEVVSANSSKLDSTTPYKSKDGLVWAFKCPTLTRHMWNKLPFIAAYPHYLEWIDSKGKDYADWYYTDTDARFMTCWW